MVVLDQERCVLCSRCIRFCDHITGTGEMQFFERGDHVAIGTFGDRPLNNPYSGNVVDICPVGALTSRDFRFKCRVWFLNSTDSVCAGCSTACNVRIDHRDGTIFRLLPRRNTEVNSSWLCDEGRLSFHEIGKGDRIARPLMKGGDGLQAPVTWEDAARAAASRMQQDKTNGSAGSVLGFASASLTNEALYLFKRYMSGFGATNIEFRFASEHQQVAEREDKILRRVDKHPNTSGALRLGFGADTAGSIDSAIQAARSGKLKSGIITYLRPLVRRDGDEAAEVKLAELLESLEYSVVLAAHKADWQKRADLVLPIAVWSEEDGTYTNYQGRVQWASRAVEPPADALPAWEVFAMLLHASGVESPWMTAQEVFGEMCRHEGPLKGISIEQTRLPGVLANG